MGKEEFEAFKEEALTKTTDAYYLEKIKNANTEEEIIKILKEAQDI